MKSIGRAGGVLCALAALAFQSGCSKSVEAGAKGPEGGSQRRDTRVVHEDCPLGSAQTLDANGDGKPDVWLVMSGGREACRAVDLNFDGKVDGYSYFDGSGQLRRRERDYDRDGKIEEISIYKAGSLSELQRSTTLAEKLDTWQYFEGGKLARTERDSDGDAIIDQWWEFSAGNEKCPMIHSDVDGDGRPDPGATIDYCKQTGYVPPSRSGPATTKHTFERPGGLPEELENKESPDAPKDAPKKEEKK
ncbi:MAG: hypothetical protein U0263_34435 [Polyangiaceae bacterium]